MSKHAKRIGRNVLLVVIGELIGKCATLAFTVVVARELGSTAFGSFSYALSFGLLLATLASWGFDSDLIRRGSADPSQLNAALTQALILRTIHTAPLILIGGYLGASTRPNEEAAQALVLVLLATLADGYGDTGRAAATACEQPGRSTVALVIQRVAACLLAIFALAEGGGLVAVAAVYLGSSLLGQLVLAAVLRGMGVGLVLRLVTSGELRRMWRATFLIGVDAVFSVAIFRVDALMLGAIAGDQELASYAVAYRLMETVLFVTWAVSRSLLPSMVRADKGRASLQVGENALAIAAAVFVPYAVILIVDGAALVNLLFGAEYGKESATALQLLAFTPLVFALSFYASYLLFVQGLTRLMLAATLIVVVVNVGLNILVIPHYGAVGAAAVTTFSYALEGLLAVIFLVRGNGVFRIDRALHLSVAAAVPMAATLLLLNAPVPVEVSAAGAIYLVTYLTLARWRDPNQLTLLVSLVKRG